MTAIKDEIIYLDEEIPEIEYYELVSIEEIIKTNPNFIAFSRDEIYHELFNFVKTRTKTENFIKLFYEIVNKKLNINNFIIVADAIRGDYEEEDLVAYITELKKYDKIPDINLSLKSKNKLWFPLKYDIDNQKIRFNPSQRTVIELSENNNYIVFKEDETNIPIMAVYFYSPITVLDDYLNDKIMSHLHKSEKLNIESSDSYETFEDLIKGYKIPLKLPLEKIDEDDYNYNTLKLSLQKYNYDFDNISIDDLNEIKIHLDKLHKKEKIDKIKYRNVDIKKIELYNPRYTFFDIMKEIKILVDLTLKSTDKITKQLKEFEDQRIKPNTILNLYSIINDLNDKNYDKIIDDIRELRKTITLDNAISKLNDFKLINKKIIIEQLDELATRFDLLKEKFKDIYQINFSCNDDEHEIHIGTDESKYEGIPTKIGRIDEKEEDEKANIDDDIKDEIEEMNDSKLIKYYKNQLYNNEIGFSELLKLLLPFVYKMEVLSGLPLDYNLLLSMLFNKYRTFESKTVIIKRYISNIDEEDLEVYLKRPFNYILFDNDVDVNKLKPAIEEYFLNLKDVIFEIIAYWSIKIQMGIVNNTLLLDYSKMYHVCDHLWEEYGVPYDMTSKTGVTIYLNCIFTEVFNDTFRAEIINTMNMLTMIDILKINDDYKKIIITKINEGYNNELELIKKIAIKKTKINEGYKYYETLYDLLKKKEYKSDKFLQAYLNALIYMPTINAKKIHKYLQGCCLERIDDNFTADLYLKTDRHDLKKAKEKLTGKRVFNMPRYKRFFIKKKIINDKVEQFNKIDNHITYDIISGDLNNWLINIKDLKKNETIFTKELIEQLLISVFKATENYKDMYISYFNNKDLKQLLNNYSFINYRQIGIAISKLLYKYLKNDGMVFITKINNTLNELDKLNSIIDDINIIDISNIRRIAVIRMMSLPSSPENIVNKKYVSSIKMDNYQELLKEIIISVINIINNGHMLNTEEQIEFINKIREINKFDILAKMNRKTREEKDIEKELKKYGLKYEDDDDIDDIQKLDVNKEKTDNDFENEGEEDFELDMEDGDDDDEYMSTYNYGFIYAD